MVATVPQFQRVYAALPHQPAKVFARLGVSTGARYCELISFTPEDFDFGGCMLTVSKSTVEVTADFHPDGHRFLTRQYTKNGEHRRMKIDAEVAEMVEPRRLGSTGTFNDIRERNGHYDVSSAARAD